VKLQLKKLELNTGYVWESGARRASVKPLFLEMAVMKPEEIPLWKQRSSQREALNIWNVQIMTAIFFERSLQKLFWLWRHAAGYRPIGWEIYFLEMKEKRNESLSKWEDMKRNYVWNENIRERENLFIEKIFCRNLTESAKRKQMKKLREKRKLVAAWQYEEKWPFNDKWRCVQDGRNLSKRKL